MHHKVYYHSLVDCLGLHAALMGAVVIWADRVHDQLLLVGSQL